ncbi:hypothetical protein DB809_19895, partial [Xanthomonas perforans]
MALLQGKQGGTWACTGLVYRLWLTGVIAQCTKDGVGGRTDYQLPSPIVRRCPAGADEGTRLRAVLKSTACFVGGGLLPSGASLSFLNWLPAALPSPQPPLRAPARASGAGAPWRA